MCIDVKILNKYSTKYLICSEKLEAQYHEIHNKLV